MCWGGEMPSGAWGWPPAKLWPAVGPEQPSPARCSPGASFPSLASRSSRVAQVAQALPSALPPAAAWDRASLLARDIGGSKTQV